MEEPLEVRYAFMMLLAMCDPTGHVIGTDVAIARRMNMPLEEFRKCIDALSQPDPDSNSMEQNGRRITPSENERGYFVVNYLTYRDMKSEEHKRKYMREYMQNYREKKGLVKSVKTPVKRVNTKLAALNHAEGEGDAEGEEPPNPQPPHPSAPLRTPPHSEPPSAGQAGKKKDNIPTTDIALRIAKMFHRSSTTKWNEKEIEAFKKAQPIHPDDLAITEVHYAKNWPPSRDSNILRHDIKTFLNNFPGEVDRARAAGANGHSNGHSPGPAPAEKGEPARWRDFLKTLNSEYRDYGSCPSVHTEFRQWKEKTPA